VSPITPLPNRVLVFVPYVVDDGHLVSPHYDVPEYRAEVEGWMQGLGRAWDWVPITADTLDAEVTRAAVMARAGDVMVLNLCDGTVADGFPGLEVVTALTAQSVPFTGAGADFYQVTTSKAVSKTRFLAAGVPTAPWVLTRTSADVDRAADTLRFPLFVKPDVSAGSYGIQLDSVVHDRAATHRQVAAVRAGLHGQSFEDEAVLIETFIEGREFTSNQLMVLEVNAQCGLSSSDSSTVGSILHLCEQRMTPIIERVIKHGMTRRHGMTR